MAKIYGSCASMLAFLGMSVQIVGMELAPKGQEPEDTARKSTTIQTTQVPKTPNSSPTSKGKVTRLPLDSLNKIVVGGDAQGGSDTPLQIMGRYRLAQAAKKAGDTKLQRPTQQHLVFSGVDDQLITNQVEILKNVDPAGYKKFMEIKDKIEKCVDDNEVASILKDNEYVLHYLDPYHLLYNAEIRRNDKNYDLAEVVSHDKPVDLSTLVHAILYRSPMVTERTATEQQVGKMEPFIDAWLEKVQADAPEAYDILMKAYDAVTSGSSSERDAIPKLLAAVDATNKAPELHGMLNTTAVEQTQGQLQAIESQLLVKFRGWIAGGGLIAFLTAVAQAITLGITSQPHAAAATVVANATVPAEAVCTLAKCLVLLYNATQS